jgi:flavin-dependent dehydrogenase
MSASYQVAVIGGGPAGSAAARTLAAGGRRVLLVEGSAAAGFKIGEALAPGARLLLDELGMGGRLGEGGHLPCHGNLSAWGSPELRHHGFISNPYGHGWHLDRARFDAALRAGAVAAGATLAPAARLLAVARRGGGWRLGLGGGGGRRQVGCDWLIDASGRAAAVARRLGVARRHDDRLLAVYARFDAAPGAPPDRDSLSFVEAAAEGWWYTARLPGVRRVAALFTDAGLPWVRRARSPIGFLDLLGRAPRLAERLGRHRYRLAEPPRATDARSGRLERFGGEGWLAAGDAAAGFDPLSSQGILTALYAGIKAGRAADAALDGDAGPLAAYDAALAGVYDHFLAQRRRHYAAEHRWPRSPFWAPRLGPDHTPSTDRREASRA